MRANAAILFGMILVTAACQPQPRQANVVFDPHSPEITAEDLRSDVFFLASDECSGRLTGTPGVWRAAQYLAAAFQQAGLKPPAGSQSYYQPFDFAAGLRLIKDRTRLDLLPSSGTTTPQTCTLDEDFRPLAYSASAVAEGEIVFVGYGMIEPSSAGKGYNSYANLDVTDKVVLALRDLPEQVSPQRRQELSLYAGDRYKAKIAADHGAKAFLLVTGPNSPNPGKLIKLRASHRTSAVPIPAASISGELAEQLLAPSGFNLRQLQTMLDDGKISPHATIMPGTRTRLSVGIEHIHKPCRNVIGMLPPTGGSDEYIMVGAHYDHIGDGIGLGSLAKKSEKGQIHNGADDNASGDAVVLELAAAFADAWKNADPTTARRGLIFACWSGEEIGLVGSSRFAKNPPLPLEKIVACFNFDMVGRLRDNRLIMQSVGSSSVWRRLIERRNIPAGFDLTLQDDPYLPTDATTFYTKGVPTLAFFTDLHEDYNRPTDDPATLNYEGMRRIADFARLLINDALKPELNIDYVKATRSAPPPGRRGRRTYTGVVPDFAAANIKGMRLSDVRPGGPAAEAGLKSGDIVVEFAGKEINSLQDYSDALIGAKAGQPVPIVVIRDGQQINLTITPGTRE